MLLVLQWAGHGGGVAAGLLLTPEATACLIPRPEAELVAALRLRPEAEILPRAEPVCTTVGIFLFKLVFGAAPRLAEDADEPCRNASKEK